MVKEKGPEHAHIVQQEEPKTLGESTKVKCKYCELVFTATSTRIRAHLLGWIRSGVRACDKVPPVVTHQFGYTPMSCQAGSGGWNLAQSAPNCKVWRRRC
jgi:hypothetical protein